VTTIPVKQNAELLRQAERIALRDIRDSRCSNRHPNQRDQILTGQLLRLGHPKIQPHQTDPRPNTHRSLESRELVDAAAR